MVTITKDRIISKVRLNSKLKISRWEKDPAWPEVRTYTIYVSTKILVVNDSSILLKLKLFSM